MRQRQSSVTIDTQYPVRSSGATCFAGRGAWGGGGPNWACTQAGASNSAVALNGIRNRRIIGLSPGSFCHTNAGAPSGPLGNLLKIRARDERLGQILGIFHDGSHGEPGVAVALLVKIVVFLECGVLAV